MTTNYLHHEIAERLPDELKNCPQWITWNAGKPKSNGKFDKFPIGRDGTSNGWQKKHQWATFDEAIADVKKYNRSGIGIVLPAKLSNSLMLVALDFDDVDISKETENPRLDEIQQHHDKLGSPYAEESPSRLGLRMFVCSSQQIPQVTQANKHGGKDELFCGSPKWVTVTGIRVGGSGVPVATDQLEQLSKNWGLKVSPSKGTSQNSPEFAIPRLLREYGRLTEPSLISVLNKINCFDEPLWNDVSNALARAYGEEGRIYFERFSKGDYWTTAYTKFDASEVNCKYDRSLLELESRPIGYGVLRIIELAGMKVDDVSFEEQSNTDNAHSSDKDSSKDSSSEFCFTAIGKNNRPQQVAENLELVLATNNICIRYNQISKRTEIVVPGLQCVHDESDNTSITVVTDLAIKSGMTANRVPELLEAIAAQNPYCPVQAYIDSKPWDQTSRFVQFANQITCSNQTFVLLLWRKWLIQAVAAAYEPKGISNAGVIVLTGEQNIGKTTFFRALTSGIPGVFIEGQTLNPADKDSVITVVSHWMVELGELDSTFKRADIAQLKAFITKPSDTVRRPYARKDSNFSRRTVFAGTVNDFQFLHDTTGNRRFWPIGVDKIQQDPLLDYQQLWAEVKSWYFSGEKWYLNNQEVSQLNQYSEQFMVNDPEIEALLSTYPFVGCTQWKPVLMRDICAKISIDRPTKPQTMKLANAIRKYNGGQKPQNSNQGGKHYVPDLDFINAAEKKQKIIAALKVGPVTPGDSFS
jgi:hypothetical protein